MLARLIDWSLRNVFLVLLATAFAIAAGVYAVIKTPVDAIPDLSDVQVIVFTEFPGQAPQVVEDQVTYPLTTAMLGVPRSKVVRGFSFFGASFVYVIFDDGTDIYWARSRVLEYLSAAAARLPAGVSPALGPDASGVGWVYQYVVTGDEPHARRTSHAAGLVHPLPVEEGAWCVRGRIDRRLRTAVRRHGRSAHVAGIQPAAVEDHRDDPHE